MKKLYKILGLIFLFILSVIYFGKSIPEIEVVSTTATSLQASTFPIVNLKVDNYNINTLHGYSTKLNSGTFRESITPLSTSKRFTVVIDQHESKIKKLSYEVLDINNNKVLEENSLSAFDTKGNKKIAELKISESLNTSTEYGLTITLTTNYSKKIYFYSRIKYYSNDFFLSQKLDFAKDFHKACFNKKSDFSIAPYLEQNTNKDDTYANVNINSNKKLITWGNLKPTIITNEIPVIHEINIETAAVSMSYYMTMNTDNGKETYYVKEFYRIRYSQGKIYLLAFNRTAEAFFNPAFVSLNKSEFKIGVTNNSNIDINSSPSNKKVSFVRNGNLWHYDLDKNKLTNIFSFNHNSSDYVRDYYAEHDIKVLNINDNGDLSFMLYGYINCGDYEGKVGILLYDYNYKKNQIVERVYMPLSTTYAQLKEDLGSFSYVNDKNIFYFSLNDKVYAYNIASKKYSYLTKHANRDHFNMLKDAKCFVWTNQSENEYATKLTILDLDSSKDITVSSPSNESIMVLGTIDTNIVYGFVKNDDIYEDSTGDIIYPAYKLIISSCKGEIVRTYASKNIYVTDASVNDNIIHLKRQKKTGSSFKETNDDTIMNQKNTKIKSVRLTTRVTQKLLTEYYLTLPAGFILDKMPDISNTNKIMVTGNTSLHLPDNEINTTAKYYIYANGQIVKSTTSASRAIKEADDKMGTVMDNSSHIIWERGGKFLSKEISSISYPSGNCSNKKAAVYMLLQSAQVTATPNNISGKSVLSMLKKYIKRPVSLIGCTLDEVLYFVSNEKPVIAMNGNDHYVLITGYTTTSVTILDPSSKSKRTMSLSAAENLFKSNKYYFISYIAE